MYGEQWRPWPDCADCFGASLLGRIKLQLKHYKITHYFVVYVAPFIQSIAVSSLQTVNLQSEDLTPYISGRAWQIKKNPLAHWASKFFFHLPSSNSYLPRICAAQIPICPRFANRNRSPTFNIALTSLWKQYSCKSQLIYRKARF